MSTETLNIDLSANTVEPTLEEQAIAAGIDVGNVDAAATEQTAKEPAQKILGKFESYEALESAYKELEKKLGAPQEKTEEEPAQRTEQEAKTETPQKTEPTPEQKAAEEATKKAGLNLEEVSQKYWQNGEKLDEADYTSLEKAGYPKAIVDQFIQGVNASRTLARQTVFNTVGGEENYTSMLEWAKGSYTAAEVTAYNEAVNSGDSAKTMLAVSGLKARYEAVKGSEPASPVEARASRANGSRYESMAQVMEDMRNPKYQKDPAFRKGVEQKLARSDI